MACIVCNQLRKVIQTAKNFLYCGVYNASDKRKSLSLSNYKSQPSPNNTHYTWDAPRLLSQRYQLEIYALSRLLQKEEYFIESNETSIINFICTSMQNGITILVHSQTIK